MKKKLVVTVCLLFTLTVVSGQDAQNTLQKMKNAFLSEQFQLSGYGQIIANYSAHPDRGPMRLTANQSFDIARAILFATGRFGAEKQYGYMLMYDFGSNACLHELYGEWLPKEAFHVRLGQYKIPFTIDNPMSPTRIETIYFSRSASAMSGNAGDFNQLNPNGQMGSVKSGRDAGLQVSGNLFPKDTFFRLEYYAGLFNGTGMNVKDNNNHKDFVASVYYQPVKGLRAGGSVYSGKLYYGLNNATPENHVRNRFAGGVEYNNPHFYGRSEYIAARDGNIHRQGYYASLVWKFVPQKWEVLGKYDFYDANTSLLQNEIRDFTAGVNYYFAPLSRLQLNYIYTENKEVGNNHAVAMQLQVFF